MSSVQTAAPPTPPGGHLFTVLANLLAEAQANLHRDPASAGACLRRATSVLSARPVQHFDEARGTIARGGLAPRQMTKVRQHIADNLSEPLDAAVLAGVVLLSTSHFSRVFRTSFGLSPYVFVSHQRVAEAKRLMTGTNGSLAEIAAACGLTDQAHLCRVFRRATGSSPAKWRRLQAGSDRPEILATLD